MRIPLGVLLAVLCIAAESFAGSLVELKSPARYVPEPSPGTVCVVPPIPSGADAQVTLRAEGWSLDRGHLWREWEMKGRRYIVEYGIRNGDGETVVLSVFPQRYSFDVNANGIFEVPGEVFVDVNGNGRCADLKPVLTAQADNATY
jgi:hypothetical protein